MEAPPGWVSTEALLRRLSDAGHVLTERQLERRRNEELLPGVQQDQLYRSSITWHPPKMADQAIALERCLRVKDRFEFAGPLLWIAGFEVGERYYAGRLERADQQIRRIRPLALWLVRKFETRKATLGDDAAALRGISGILSKVTRRAASETPRFLNTVLTVAEGKFDKFDQPATDRETATEDVFKNAFGFRQCAEDKIFGSQLRLDAALEQVLAEIAGSHKRARIADFTLEEIEAARDDVHKALKTATCFYEATSWVYGPRAFGASLPAFFARTAGTDAIFLLIMGFAHLRKSGADFYSSAEIAKMARQAEATWLISAYFRELHKSGSHLIHLINPRKLKIGFSNSTEHKKMLTELGPYQFPAPEFRPWNSWQTLANKKMSPGLLVMSIGSPERLSLEDALANANGTAAH